MGLRIILICHSFGGARRTRLPFSFLAPLVDLFEQKRYLCAILSLWSFPSFALPQISPREKPRSQAQELPLKPIPQAPRTQLRNFNRIPFRGVEELDEAWLPKPQFSTLLTISGPAQDRLTLNRLPLLRYPCLLQLKKIPFF